MIGSDFRDRELGGETGFSQGDRETGSPQEMLRISCGKGVSLATDCASRNCGAFPLTALPAEDGSRSGLARLTATFLAP